MTKGPDDGYARLYEQEYDRVARTVYLVVRDAGRAEDLTRRPSYACTCAGGR